MRKIGRKVADAMWWLGSRALSVSARLTTWSDK